MAKMKRVVAPGYPYHAVKRGESSMNIFFQEQDRVDRIPQVIMAAR